MHKHLATVALAFELSTLCAVAAFLIAAFTGQPALDFT